MIDRLLGRLLLASRYILVLFYGGLLFGLLLYGFVFVHKLLKMTLDIEQAEGFQGLLNLLSLIDSALVANLAIMVILSNYEAFVGRIVGDQHRSLAWLGRLDPNALKIKVASTIITIAAVFLLQVMIDVGKHDPMQVRWQIAIFFCLVVAGLALALIDRLRPSPAAVYYQPSEPSTAIVGGAAGAAAPGAVPPQGMPSPVPGGISSPVPGRIYSQG